MTVLRRVVGAALFAAGALKLGGATAFAEAIANYRLLPAAANQILGVALPWWEISTGVLLLLGLWPRAASILAAGLFGAFFVATASALARGLDVACGCFGTGAVAPAAFTLAMDALGLAGAVTLARSTSSP